MGQQFKVCIQNRCRQKQGEHSPGGRQETPRCVKEAAAAGYVDKSLDLEAGGHIGTGQLASG